MTLAFAREPETQAAGTVGQSGSQIEHVRVISKIIHMIRLSHESVMSEFRDGGIHDVIERILSVAQAHPATTVDGHRE
ncbi:hypothetical protein GCM10020254_49670 [Streptomyces goshikiensis]